MTFSTRSREALAAITLVAGLMTGVFGGAAADDSASRSSSNSPEQEAPRTQGPQDQPVPASDGPDTSRAAGVELPEEAELRERVQARWNAVLEGKLDKAYTFETPEYRKAHSEQEYRAEFGRQVRWHVATLKDLRYDRADEVEAVITLDYSFALPGSAQLVRTSSDITERWVYSDHQWWRRHGRSTLVHRPRPQPPPPP